MPPNSLINLGVIAPFSQDGARIAIHSPSVLPPVADGGIDIQTNTLTNIALVKVANRTIFSFSLHL